MSYLEDSYITRGFELKDRYTNVINNEHFKNIIRREIEMMFGNEEKKANASINNSKINDTIRS